ncbi:hypothetical protein EMIHUDRAFT_117574 [Emiliania huxleyi CCMP1516]|uniref:C3H1-type domain-containing protein n=2 Tax=Emiliania huxleyi TaxID=2903 RepID=A0A0D3JA41_EMIH1|nr:hypothetical protein EMIHUDRAFT_117574 [Emiliania huxleyi CCMP1516]EOD20376.1 hypothetical protein EMIHUDRAFT_117574 [Emiliania huxleyi CCMP1516]|eukprot:XP_005772805.1 hypothetical protein EMIHUDRAFT_117574 [Emiliania huxleyi CCMP1516]
MLLTWLLHSSTAFTLARAPVLNGHPLAPATRARHHAVVAREIAFVAQSEARCEPFAATRARPLGDWFAQEDALRILMSQAESCRRLDEDAPPGSETQRWEVVTPIEFPGMKGRCNRRECMFRHDDSGQIEECREFMNGRCSRGDACRFKHVAMDNTED